jgi:hypothetical protein
MLDFIFIDFFASCSKKKKAISTSDDNAPKKTPKKTKKSQQIAPVENNENVDSDFLATK